MRSATQLEEEWRVRGERAAEYSAKLEAALTMAEGEAVALRRRARRTRRASMVAHLLRLPDRFRDHPRVEELTEKQALVRVRVRVRVRVTEKQHTERS